MWPNFAVVKYNSKIPKYLASNKVLEKYNKQVFYKKAVLKNFAIYTEKKTVLEALFK